MLKIKNYVKAESLEEAYVLNPEAYRLCTGRNGMAENGQSQCNYSY